MLICVSTQLYTTQGVGTDGQYADCDDRPGRNVGARCGALVVGFEVEYLGGTFKGTFREIDATLVVGDDSVSLEGTAKVASVDVKDENLAGHLQSPEFFDIEQYPEIRFTAKDISLDGRRQGRRRSDDQGRHQAPQ